MEGQIEKHNYSIKIKIPDIQNALDSIVMLEDKTASGVESMQLDYMVSNNLWAAANIEIKDKLFIWLGADVMCEFTLEEAKELLLTNLENAKTTKERNVC